MRQIETTINYLNVTALLLATGALLTTNFIIGFPYTITGLVSHAIISIIVTYKFLSITTDTENIFKIDGLFWLTMISAYLISPGLAYYSNQFYPLIPKTDKWDECANLYLIFGAYTIFIFSTLSAPEKLKATHQTAHKKKYICAKKLHTITPLVLLFAASLQILMYIESGGVSGFINSFTEFKQGSIENLQTRGAVLTIIAESLPYILSIYLLENPKTHRIILSSSKNALTIIFFLSFIAIFFGGLRGSRSSVILFSFWLTFYIHLKKPEIINRKAISVIFVAAMTFMVSYSFYKTYGGDWAKEITYESLAENKRYNGNVLTGVILGDFSRFEIQSNIIDAILNKDREVWLGQSIISGLALPIPIDLSGIISDKVTLGTKTLYGDFAYETGQAKSRFIYGLIVEFFANFHVFGVLACPFILLLARRMLLIPASRATNVTSPWLPLLSFTPIILTNLFMSDIGNLVFYIFKYMTIPTAYILLVTTKQKEVVKWKKLASA